MGPALLLSYIYICVTLVSISFPEIDVAFGSYEQQYGANGMLDDWEENLAVIAANRTKDDGLVIVHLGDSLWKERSDVSIT